MSGMLLLPLLLLVPLALAQPPTLLPWQKPHEDYFKYKFQTHYRFDGYAAKVNGGPTFSTTGSDVAMQFFKTFVVDGFEGNGTDAQVLALRAKAITFYTDRYGLIFPNPLPADPGATLVLKYANGTDSDSVVTPILLDTALASRALAIIPGKTGLTFPAAQQWDCGYYLFVGPSGYPAGGSFGKPLPPGSAGTYGVQAIHNVCPKIKHYCKSCCKGSQGQVLLNVMSQELLTPTPDPGWAVGNNSPLDQLGPAIQAPIQIAVHHKEFGSGLCSGLFYAVPYNTTTYSLLHSAACYFPAPSGYPVLPMVLL